MNKYLKAVIFSTIASFSSANIRDEVKEKYSEDFNRTVNFELMQDHKYNMNMVNKDNVTTYNEELQFGQNGYTLNATSKRAQPGPGTNGTYEAEFNKQGEYAGNEFSS